MNLVALSRKSTNTLRTRALAAGWYSWDDYDMNIAGAGRGRVWLNTPAARAKLPAPAVKKPR